MIIPLHINLIASEIGAPSPLTPDLIQEQIDEAIRQGKGNALLVKKYQFFDTFVAIFNKEEDIKELGKLYNLAAEYQIIDLTDRIRALLG